MPPKRVADAESSENPKKRVRKTASSSQQKIETFFSKGKQAIGFQTPHSPASQAQQSLKLQAEVIVIDDSSDDEQSDRRLAIGDSAEAANSARSALSVPSDVGVASSSTSEINALSSGGTDFLRVISTKRPSGPTVQNHHFIHIPGAESIPSIMSNTSESLPCRPARGLSASSSGPLPFDTSAIIPFPDFTVDPLAFESGLDASRSPWWSQRTSAPYAILVHALQALTSTRSRIAILSILTNLLRVLVAHDPDSVRPALYLLSNSLSPAWEGIELGVGGSIISKALQTTTSITPTAMRALYKKHGDPGDVAYYAVVGNSSAPRTSVLRPHPPLLIQSLYDDLRKIASAKGEGSQKLRQTLVEKLMLSAVGSSWKSGQSSSYVDLNPHLLGEEPRYLIRTLVHNLRVGAVRTTILSALARAITLTPPREVTISSLEGPQKISSADLNIVKGVLQAQGPSTSPRKGQSSIKRGQSEEFTNAYERVQAALKQADTILRRAFAQHPSYDDIVVAVLDQGIEGLLSPSSRAGLALGTPLLPTLGSPMRSLEQIYELLGPQASWCAEKKYDGQRAQVHAWRENGTITARIFSRHLENMTDKYPDLVHLIVNTMEADNTLDSFIVDAEAVAIDPSTGELRSFQELAGRARKDVQIADIKVAVCLFLFDMMLLNGTVLIEKPFRERRRLLQTHLPPTKSLATGNTDENIPHKYVRATLDHVESIDAQEGRDAVQEFWERAIESKCEGLMIKLLDDTVLTVDDQDEQGLDDTMEMEIDLPSPQKPSGKKSRRKALPATYEPDKRTSAWLKLKKDYVEGIGDSIDMVPVGAWHGNGRKAAWWSPILLALYDSERGIFVAMCKCMSGFTDAFYKGLNERYPIDSDTCSKSPQWNVETGGYQPSVYFKPSEVWEIRGADLTVSPTSVAALGLLPDSRDKGVSLRFPRFIRIREDKNIELASSPTFVYQLWVKQESKGGTRGGVDEGDLVDYVEEEEAIEDEYESEGDPG